MTPRINTTDLSAAAEPRSSVGGGLRYTLISAGVLSVVVSATLVVQGSLPRCLADFAELPVLGRCARDILWSADDARSSDVLRCGQTLFDNVWIEGRPFGLRKRMAARAEE
jgi:hypothetical protein